MLLMSTFAMSVILRRGIMAASTLRFLRSAPEYPLVIFTSSSMSFWLKIMCLLPLSSLSINRCKNCLRPAPLGKGIYNFLTRRRLTASSRSLGRFVAPIISIRASSPAKVFAPSSYTKNSVFILREPS